MHRRLFALSFALVVLILGEGSAADPAKYPEGLSSQTHKGFAFQLLVPAELDATKKHALVVALHAAKEKPETLIKDLESVADDGRILCAPKARSTSWSTSEVKSILALVDHLKEVLPIDDAQIHAIGDGHGGSLLRFLTFQKKSPFDTACFINAGFQGGSVAKDAKKRLSVLALVGANSSARSNLEKIEERLSGKVRSVEMRIAPNTTGEWFPRELVPYLRYWLGTKEGRFVPGETLVFDWLEDMDDAKERLHSNKCPGALLYFFSDADAESEDAKMIQNETLHRSDVRGPARSLVAVKLDRSEHEELFASLGLKKTPAIAVLDGSLEPVKVFESPIKAPALAKVLKKLAKERT